MRQLKEIPTKNFCAIDVETVRIEENFLDLTEDFQSAWEYKNKQDGRIPEQLELEDMWSRTSSLYAEFSKVCAISIAFLDSTETKLMVKEFFGDNEVEILEGLAEYLGRMDRKGNFRLLAHAGKYFDYPYLCKRYIINGLDIPNILDTSHLKPWENRNLCTNQDIWKMGGTGPGSSLQALCTALGIPISKVDLVGDAVGKAYFDGEYARIGRYCSYDTIATFNIVRKIKKEGVFNFEDAKYIEDSRVGIEESPVLHRIYNQSAITKRDEEELKELLKGKKLTEKNKEILVDMLHQLSVSSEMFKGDKEEVKAKKLEEAKKLIGEL